MQISLKFVAKGQIDNKAVLVQVMVWCQTALSEPLLCSLLTHICDTREMS